MKYVLEWEGCEWYISKSLAEKYRKAGYHVKAELEDGDL